MPCQPSTFSWETAPVIATVICFVSLTRFLKRSREVRPGGSLPACAWDAVGGYSPQSLSARLQDGFRLLHLPLPPAPSVCLAAFLPCMSRLLSAGAQWAYRVQCASPEGLGAALFAGGVVVHDGGCYSLRAVPHTFWCEPVSIFGSCVN
jgi:hypothetical protein